MLDWSCGTEDASQPQTVLVPVTAGQLYLAAQVAPTKNVDDDDVIAAHEFGSCGAAVSEDATLPWPLAAGPPSTAVVITVQGAAMFSPVSFDAAPGDHCTLTPLAVTLPTMRDSFLYA
jgi:hypothetical protein